MELKQKFIILKKSKYSESDLILHALSSQGAKVSFIARGALNSKKRFGGGVLEPSHYLILNYKPSKSLGQLNILTEAELINDFNKIRTSYDKLEFALHTLEVVYKVSVEEDQSSESLFNLLGQTLKAIEVAEEMPKLKLQFYLKFLLQQGVLTIEPWMKIFLKTPIADNINLIVDYSLITENLLYIEASVKNYIQTAMTLEG